jgi:hypothetical protein
MVRVLVAGLKPAHPEMSTAKVLFMIDDEGFQFVGKWLGDAINLFVKPVKAKDGDEVEGE